MKRHIPVLGRKTPPKVIFWILVAVYTLILPDARLAYDAIVNAFGQEAAGKIPLITVTLFTLAYGIIILVRRRKAMNLLYLLPCGIISYLIMAFVDNPNKHIHIPEYILMTWLLYAALSGEVHGAWLFVLVFFYASLLGIVDELEQGIHPNRFYGWSDMLVNSASSLVGVLTILGLIGRMAPASKGMGFGWKQKPRLPALCLLGLIDAGIICAYLFQVQAAGTFRGIYPVWLLAVNLFYLSLALFGLVSNVLFSRNRPGQSVNKGMGTPYPEGTSKGIPVFPLLVILIYIHALVVFLAVSRVEFV